MSFNEYSRYENAEMINMKTEKEVTEQLERTEENIRIFCNSDNITSLEREHITELKNQVLTLKWVLED
jgi:hypothetical protein